MKQPGLPSSLLKEMYNMKGRTLIVPILMMLIGAQALFAQAEYAYDYVEYEIADITPLYVEDEVADITPLYAEYPDYELAEAEPVIAEPAEVEIPAGIRNNRFFLESVRLTILAQQAFDEGDYLASSEFSQEAIRFAALSDEYVYLQLRIWETDNAITAARIRLTFAATIQAAVRYPNEYSEAQAAYGEALAYRRAEGWDDAIDAAQRVLIALAAITGLEQAVAGQVFLPAQFTVRDWLATGDSLWAISGRAWAFGDPWQWRRLYEANRDRLPQPGNPNLIHPGMILDIPSIRGEIRQGMWQEGVTYPPLP